MDDFEHDGERLVRRDLNTTPLWMILASIPAFLAWIGWFAWTLAADFRPGTVAWTFVLAFASFGAYKAFPHYRDNFNVLERRVFFDRGTKRFGEVIDRRLGSPILRTWPLDTITAIDIGRSSPWGAVFGLNSVARLEIRIRSERQPFVVRFVDDPLKAEASAATLRRHLGL